MECKPRSLAMLFKVTNVANKETKNKNLINIEKNRGAEGRVIEVNPYFFIEGRENWELQKCRCVGIRWTYGDAHERN